jgi:ABC-type nitrate/sulfonate/bicarbonate transport system substrate-binding protein
MRDLLSILFGVAGLIAQWSAHGEGPDRLRVMGFAGSSNWPLFVAQERALFAAQGLQVEFSAAPSSTAQLADLREGRLEIALTAMDNIVAHIEELFAFVGINNGGRASLMVAPGIRGPAELKGRRLAVDAAASGYAFVLMEMLARGGLAPGDYDLLSVGGSRDRLAALQSGKAAGALLNAPTDAAAEAAGFVRLGTSADVLKRYQGSVGAARRSWAAENADALVRYIRAQVAAVDWLYQPANRAAAIAILRSRLSLGAQAAERSYDELLDPVHGSLSRRAALDAEGVRTVLELRQRYAKPAFPLGSPESYYDLRYYEKALAP